MTQSLVTRVEVGRVLVLASQSYLGGAPKFDSRHPDCREAALRVHAMRQKGIIGLIVGDDGRGGYCLASKVCPLEQQRQERGL